VTKTDIIHAAFRAWGRDFYKNPSLSSLAKELKVSKPALYRHFLCKDALTTAMTEHFCRDLADSIRIDFEQALAAPDPDEGLYTIIKALSGYFGRNVYSLIFNLTNIYEKKIDGRAISERIKTHGVDMQIMSRIIEKKYAAYPSNLHLILATLIFNLSIFHKNNKSLENAPTPEQIDTISFAIYETSLKGLGLSSINIDTIDYEKLEAMLKNKIEEKIKIDPIEPLFKAVAEAVAEAGPWKASMEMVAKHMGLSKSSLYGHFKNKKDMLRRLFITEFKRIIDFARHGISLSSNPAEQLYLGIYSIAIYLRSRPEILISIDWIRTRKLDLGKPDKDLEIFKLFEDININSMQNISQEEKQKKSHWIFFLLINILMRMENEKAEINILRRIHPVYVFYINLLL